MHAFNVDEIDGRMEFFQSNLVQKNPKIVKISSSITGLWRNDSNRREEPDIPTISGIIGPPLPPDVAVSQEVVGGGGDLALVTQRSRWCRS